MGGKYTVAVCRLFFRERLVAAFPRCGCPVNGCRRHRPDGQLVLSVETEKPLEILMQASEKISANDLGFHISYDSRDEMGNYAVYLRTCAVSWRKPPNALAIGRGTETT